MATLNKNRKIESGKLFDAYFESAANKDFDTVYIDGENREYRCFDFEKKTFAVTGYDHYNGHLSGYTDQAAIYGLYISEVAY